MDAFGGRHCLVSSEGTGPPLPLGQLLLGLWLPGPGPVLARARYAVLLSDRKPLQEQPP